MKPPRLADLPAPPPGRTGWPWTEETAGEAPGSLPSFTVVTPSFNQGAFLEETIRSVLLQGYPGLEYIVLDGGSTDGSVDIIRKYEPWLAYWTSGPDGGQSAAIQKGMERAAGVLSSYLNSDDIYYPGSLRALAAAFVASNAPEIVYGNEYRIDPESLVVEEHRNTPFSDRAYLYGGAFFQQPATIWRTDAMRAAGGFDPSVRFEMDNDLFMRIAARGARFAFVRRFVAGFRIHPASKSSTIMTVSRDETARIREKYLPIPFDSPRASMTRLAARLTRTVHYTLQGDLPWLLRRAMTSNRNRTFAE